MTSDRIYSILTAFPAMMLIVALYFYYSAENEQAGGELQLEQQQHIVGTFKGLSGTNINRSGQVFLWVTAADRDRGMRIDGWDADELVSLQKGDSLEVWAAPRVEGSRVLWVFKVISGGKQIFVTD